MKRKAFGLIELLLYMMLMMVVLPLIISPARVAVERASMYIDKRAAIARIAQINSLIYSAAFYCGYGMPSDPVEYQNYFDTDNVYPFNWQGPISVYAVNGKSNGKLRVVFGKNSDAEIADDVFIHNSEGTITLTKSLSSYNVKSEGSLLSVYNVLTVGDMFPHAVPLIVTKVSGKNYSVRVNDSEVSEFYINKEQPVFVFYGAELFSNNGKLYSYNMRVSGNQPRVNGVEDIRFYIEGNMLTVVMLVRGVKKFSAKKNSIMNLERAPQELKAEWQNVSSDYRLYVSKSVWSLPNCLD